MKNKFRNKERKMKELVIAPAPGSRGFDRSKLNQADITSLCDAAVVAWEAAGPKTCGKVHFSWRQHSFVSYPTAETDGCPDDF